MQSGFCFKQGVTIHRHYIRCAEKNSCDTAELRHRKDRLDYLLISGSTISMKRTITKNRTVRIVVNFLSLASFVLPRFLS